MPRSDSPFDDDSQTGHATAYAKWGSALDAGFQIVPNVLIRAQTKLGLDPLDLAILLNILVHWWRPEELPYPRTSMIANRIGVSVRTVERRIEKMQSTGLIVRHPTEKTPDGLGVRRFDLTGLVERLRKFARANLEMRERGVYYDDRRTKEDVPAV
jgi:DNA-binding MarR family transcriptional regulator